MRAEQVLSSAMLDILFENRNKGYGAYNLRKFYNNRLVKALAGMMLLATLLFIFVRMSVKENVKLVVPDVRDDKLSGAATGNSDGTAETESFTSKAGGKGCSLCFC